tara:strand:- start:67 stop:207 length:141 start_codon:yes stop_codon:yes gene_type:complete
MESSVGKIGEMMFMKYNVLIFESSSPQEAIDSLATILAEIRYCEVQ